MSRREWLSLIVIFTLVVAAFVVPVYAVIRVNDVQLEVTCTSARSNIQQISALQDIAIELGIPQHFTVPALPPECADHSPE